MTQDSKSKQTEETTTLNDNLEAGEASDVDRLFKVVGTDGQHTYKEFPTKIGMNLARQPEEEVESDLPNFEIRPESVSIQAEPELKTDLNLNTDPNPVSYDKTEKKAKSENSDFQLLNKVIASSQIDNPIEFKAQSNIPCLGLYSPLGGAGSSTLAVGLAWELAKHNQSSLIADLGGTGMARLFFGQTAQIIENKGAWARTMGRFQGNNTLIGLAIGNRKAASVLANNLLDWASGNTPVSEVLDLTESLNKPAWFIVDFVSARFEFMDILDRLDVLVVPLRVGLETVLAVEEMQAKLKSINKTKDKPLTCYYVLNQFEEKDLLHREVLRSLQPVISDYVKILPIQRDPEFNRYLAQGKPFESRLFQNYLKGIMEITLDWSLMVSARALNV